MKSNILLFFFLLLLLNSLGRAQDYTTAGGYAVKNYGVKNYGMHPSNYYITQDDKGILYFGNAYGLMEYDGTNWRKINISNGGSGLSMARSPNGSMHIGSYNELGCLTNNTVGTSIYESYYPKLPATEQNIGGIQQVIPHGDKMMYQSYSGLYLYNKNTFEVIKPHAGGCFIYSKKIKNNIYVQEAGKGLQILKKKQLQLINNGDVFKNSYIKELIPLPDNQLLVLKEDGLFLFDEKNLRAWNIKTNQILKEHQLTHALTLQNGNYLITTNDHGFYIVNPSGELLKHVSIENGLQSNHINYAFIDQGGGLWLALDNGISYIEINSPFSFIGNSAGIIGMGYTAAYFEGNLYVGTSQGLFYTPWKNEEGNHIFKPVSHISGQIWNLSIINNTLLCCQVEGTYQIKNTTAHKIAGGKDQDGHWKISPLKNKPNHAIKGTYEGFHIYVSEHGQWKFSHKIEGFSESCRTFEEHEEGVIWMCHGNKGLYKILLSDDLKSIDTAINYSTLKGYAPDFFNDVTLIDNQLVFSADDGAYILDLTHDQFLKYTALEQIIGTGKYLNKMIQDQYRNLWVFSGNDILLYDINTQTNNFSTQTALKKISGELVGSYEFVMPINKDLAIIGSQEGFILFKPKAQTRSLIKYNTLIRKIEAPFQHDTLLFGGHSTQNQSFPTWDYTFNALRFSFAAPYYENSEKKKYQYALHKTGDLETHWSTWTNNTQVEFSNLWEGNYLFKVRAKNIYDEISEEGSYRFSILPPWYRSNTAYALYFIVLVLSIGFSYKYIRTRFIKQKERLNQQRKKELLLQEQKHLTEKLLTEKELIALRNEKLEAEVVLKNNELASLATTITQKTEFLSHLKDKLEIIHKASDHTENDVFKEVIKTIDQDLDFDDNWANFQLHFDQLHHNFLHRLRNQYPKLNPSWLLLCAYIRMNKSNKEIAAHMNISVAGVEKRKYRLREKLDLEADAKLSDFIVNF